MYKFGIRFFDGSCKYFECRNVRGVRYLSRMYLTMRKKDIDCMLCFVNGDVWKWKSGKWEKKKSGGLVSNGKEMDYIDVEELWKWRIKSEDLRMRQYRINFE